MVVQIYNKIFIHSHWSTTVPYTRKAVADTSCTGAGATLELLQPSHWEGIQNVSSHWNLSLTSVINGQMLKCYCQKSGQYSIVYYRQKLTIQCMPVQNSCVICKYNAESKEYYILFLGNSLYLFIVLSVYNLLVHFVSKMIEITYHTM